MPKVSILIPIYNVEKYLGQCLESIINQTLKDIEIICINDGSSDASAKILNEYAKKDPRIVVISKKNTGYGHSMNVGLKKAMGDYIGIVESDDFIDRSMFEDLYNAAVSHKVDIVKSNYFAHNVLGDFFEPRLDEFPYEKIFRPRDVYNLFRVQPTIWSAIYDRKFLLKNDIYFNETPGAAYQDLSFTVKVFVCAESIYLLRNAYLHYRIDNQNSSVNSTGKVFCICDEYNEIIKFLERKKLLDSELKYLVELLRFDSYRWNYERLNEKNKMCFAQRIIVDFNKAKANNLLKRAYWGDQDWEELNYLLKNSDEYFCSKMCEKQNLLLYKKALLDRLNSKKYIILYGAGYWGQRDCVNLKKAGIMIKAFAVSNMSKNQSAIMDIPVIEIEKLCQYKNDCIILVTPRSSIKIEIVKKLFELDFSDIILMNTEVRNSLYR